MDFNLIYKPLTDFQPDENHFKKCNNEVVQNEIVKIICPYLSIDYLKELTSTCKSWLLISDVEAWIVASPFDSRNSIKDFITKNLDNIHNLKNLHAKVLCSQRSAVVGSANFTNSGMNRNVEFSVFIKDEMKVKEINIWANQLWEHSYTVILTELDDFLISIINIDSTKLNSNKVKHLSQKNSTTKSKNRYKTAQHKDKLIKMFEKYVLIEMGERSDWVIEQRLAHIHGHKAGLKIWVEGRQRDFEIRDYFSDKENDNRDGVFFYKHMMNHPENVPYEKITCVKEDINRNKPKLRFKKIKN